MSAPLKVSRQQVVDFRRRVGALDERLPRGARSLRRAAWAGLQDSMPRAAVLSIHARVHRTEPSTWEDPSLVQLWGPRFSVFVVAAADLAVFSLGRYPDDPRQRAVAEDLATRLRDLLGDQRMTYGEAGRALGERNANRLRYATTTGTVLLRWEGARQPVIWSVPRPDVDPFDARVELARRFLHVYGPSTSESFAQWSGIGPREANSAFDRFARSLVPVRTPVGDAFILGRDEASFRIDAGPVAPARLLPSGDAFYLLQKRDRELLVPNTSRAEELWTSRVWPGAVLVDGEVVGTWRRADRTVSVRSWRRLSRPAIAAVEAEAMSLPLPDLTGPITLRWER